MSFKMFEKVALKGTEYVGQIVGYVGYYQDANALVPMTMGVVVCLGEKGFYDPTGKAYIRMMICQEDTLEAVVKNLS